MGTHPLEPRKWPRRSDEPTHRAGDWLIAWRYFAGDWELLGVGRHVHDWGMGIIVYSVLLLTGPGQVKRIGVMENNFRAYTPTEEDLYWWSLWELTR